MENLQDSNLRDSGPHDSGLHDSGLHDSGLHDSGLHDSGLHDSGLLPLSSLPSSSVAPLGPQQELGRYLSTRRDALNKSVDEISRITKIPKASLLHLEAGRFGSLPGDVFVRGFLRSYARCLELDGDDVVSRYALCGLNPAPVSSEMAESLLGNGAANKGKRIRRFPKATRPLPQESTAQSSAASADSPAADPRTLPGKSKNESARGETVRRVLRDAFDLAPWQRSTSNDEGAQRARQTTKSSPEDEAPLVERVRSFVPPRLDFNDEMSHRGPLTLGVIILVIVATLTMSYLLRRPGTSVDGFTMAPANTDDRFLNHRSLDHDAALDMTLTPDTLQA